MTILDTLIEDSKSKIRVISPQSESVITQMLTCNRWAATVGPQPLRRLITPIGFGDKISNSNVTTLFGQAFLKKLVITLTKYFKMKFW
jgi:hypothetical protein